MRRLELILVFGAVFAVAWPAVFGVRSKRGIACGLLTTLFILHWQLEGLRWQMLPLYLTALGLGVGDILSVERRLDWTRRIARGLFGTAGIGLAAVLPLVLPVPDLPAPSGPETVGTVTIELVDGDREETYGESPGGPRRLVAQVWYPALSSGVADPVPWSEDWEVVAPAMARSIGLPGWFFSHTRYTLSSSYPSLPVAPGKFPVVVYSHGWRGFRDIAVNQAETLASNGFMVIALDHTYGAIATRFESGEVAPNDPAALPEPDTVDAATYEAAARALVDTFAADVVTLFDALDAGVAGPLGSLAGSADLDLIGVYGHSTGGGAAIQVCLVDERCDAVLAFDPWVAPLADQVISRSMPVPALYMRSDEWRGDQNDALLRGIAERGEATTYWTGIRGASHNDFTLAPLLSPLADRVGIRGPIAAGKVLQIIDRYLLGFFDVHLLGTGPAALETASFSEVSVEVITPG